MKKVLIVGSPSAGISFTQCGLKEITGIILVDKEKEIDERKNVEFKSVPKTNYPIENFEPKINNPPRSKYLDKPRNNYKK